MSEQERVLEALQMALQMETDGKVFYLKASRNSEGAGKALFKSLAAEEEQHGRTFKFIYASLREKNQWLKPDFKPDGGQRLRTVFLRAIQQRDPMNKPQTELDAIQTAMAMESKSYDYYERLARQATYAGEKDFYEALASQEREHHLVLLDYFEYLKDPAAWFVKQEHPSLDAGS